MRTVLALVVVAACARSTPSEPELLSAAQNETRRFFAIGESGDCDELSALMQRPGDCQNLVHQFKESHVHLTKIEGAKLDGRDKHVVLVSVQAQSPERVHQWIVRAKWTREGWKLAL